MLNCDFPKSQPVRSKKKLLLVCKFVTKRNTLSLQPRLFNTRLNPLSRSNVSIRPPDPLPPLVSPILFSLSSNFVAPTAKTQSASFCAPAVYCSSLCAPSASLSILNSSEDAIVPIRDFVVSSVVDGWAEASEVLLREMLERRVWRWSA